MQNTDENPRALSAAQIERFIHDGFVKIDRAFAKAMAADARQILWRDTGCDPDNPSTWTRPVIRLGMYTERPLVDAANTPILHRAFDQLTGQGRWLPCMSMGTFPVRFPSPHDPGDAGWHIDVSFGFDDPDFMNWRANVQSRGRLLLMLFLFSDVGENDAPTRIRVGSHLDIARRLASAGDAGLTLRDLAASDFAETSNCREVLASGEAGTVYLCHPFLVHAAQPHRGTRPRFLAQPPLLPREPAVSGGHTGGRTPIEEAIHLALR
ncbi:phytanoyl-CoA dioxygenase family protein [Hyphomicrobium sp.]|uniref:phytanoyl-CoA dioxygenase family protein n=1 Tax=Hyphomicrobium sp. TaxID=82 RepID=UPI002E35BDBC|nr:phytanoyl-CoA dioxygenase family protein [Hyphomicrobium sp.]HEX2842984.1 phytanoyl-CoA dioxygenase family protein [Hyphomicrobium sp.]